MQRNWIGRSTGAAVLFSVAGEPTSRCSPPGPTPCSAPPTWCWPRARIGRHRAGPVAGRRGPQAWTGGAATPAAAVAAYRQAIAAKSDLERQENKTKTGVFLGTYAVNPTNGQHIPVFIADYVLVGYGTGAIMAVPGHDQRDWEFATEFGLPIVEVISGGDISEAAYAGDGALVNSGYLDGLTVGDAKRDDHRAVRGRRRAAAASSTSCGTGCSPANGTGASRFPIVYDADGRAHPLPDSMLPWNCRTCRLLAGAVRSRRRRQPRPHR